MTNGSTLGSSAIAPGAAGSTRSSIPPRLLALAARLPSTRNASPPNMRFSTTPASPSTASRMRAASSTS